jgi:hypothetical protein
MTVFQEDQMTD